MRTCTRAAHFHVGPHGLISNPLLGRLIFRILLFLESCKFTWCLCMRPRVADSFNHKLTLKRGHSRDALSYVD